MLWDTSGSRGGQSSFFIPCAFACARAHLHLHLRKDKNNIFSVREQPWKRQAFYLPAVRSIYVRTNSAKQIGPRGGWREITASSTTVIKYAGLATFFAHLPQKPCHPVTGLGAHRDPVTYPVYLERHLLCAAPGRQRVVRAHLLTAVVSNRSQYEQLFDRQR